MLCDSLSVLLILSQLVLRGLPPLHLLLLLFQSPNA